VHKVHAVVGGFHLGPAPADYLSQVVAEIGKLEPDVIIPMHCSGNNLIEAVRQQMPDKLLVPTTGSRIAFGAWPGQVRRRDDEAQERLAPEPCGARTTFRADLGRAGHSRLALGCGAHGRLDVEPASRSEGRSRSSTTLAGRAPTRISGASSSSSILALPTARTSARPTCKQPGLHSTISAPQASPSSHSSSRSIPSATRPSTSRNIPLFHPRLIRLTGDNEAIRRVALAYKAFYAKAPSKTRGDYSVDHTSFIYLIGLTGQYLGFLPPKTGPDRLAQVIRGHLPPGAPG
jgi:hypothetical protein